MRAVAIGADGRFRGAAFDGPSMHALLVGDEGLRAHAIRLHQKLLSVAAATGSRNMRVIDGRIWMAAGQHLMRAAMAILAIRRDLAAGDNLRVCAVRVSSLCIGMAVSAENLLRWRIVRQALHVFVAVHTGEFHRAVDGVLELLAVNEKRDGLAVHIGGEGRVTVAGETIFVFQLVLGASVEGRAQQKERKRTEHYSAGYFHVYEETPLRIWLP